MNVINQEFGQIIRCVLKYLFVKHIALSVQEDHISKTLNCSGEHF
jgi:hypothetical protein